MTLLLAIQPAGGNWSPQAWLKRFSQRYNGDVVVHGTGTYDPAAIQYVAAWKPPQGLIATLPNLRVVFNLGAGVDALLADATLPAHVPIVRVVDEDLTRRMTEYVVLHVLDHHRQMPAHRAAQAQSKWIGPVQVAAKDMRVGLMGLGEIARDAAEVLLRLGFQVQGWSRSARSVPGVRHFAGHGQLRDFLAATDILVVLLPLTAETRGIINRQLLSGLSQHGPLGKPVLINAGRGGLQVEADILACLDDGTLGAATLDVFETEPLPTSSALWRHPRVTITPHNAADTDPETISASVAAQIAAFERGAPLPHVVDRARGY